MGLTGFSGLSKDGPHLPGFGGGTDGPAREVSAFVKARWSEDEWETAWCALLHRALNTLRLIRLIRRFVNPPTLQSVKGLPHFHVLAKRKA